MIQPPQCPPLTFTCTPFPGPTPGQFSILQGCPTGWGGKGSYLALSGSVHPPRACLPSGPGVWQSLPRPPHPSHSHTQQIHLSFQL